MKQIKTTLKTAALFLPGILAAQVTIDGFRNPSEGYTEITTQTVTSNWSEGYLANLHALQDGNTLHLHLASTAINNAVIIFIDSKAGGTPFIPNNLIQGGGEGFTINNLGNSNTDGLTFETGFEADYAIRIYGNGNLDGSFVNFYDLNSGDRYYLGEISSNPASGGPVLAARTAFTADIPADNSTANQGIELALRLGALGVPFGNQEVKLTAVLVNDNSTYGSNQFLGSRNGITDDSAFSINSLDLNSAPGTQTLTLNVNHPDDGIDPTLPGSRAVTFQVNTRVAQKLGLFNPNSDSLRLVGTFWNNFSTNDGPILTDENGDGIYEVTLDLDGYPSNFFTNFKFFTDSSNLPGDWNGYERSDDRVLVLGIPGTPQVLPPVFFGLDNFNNLANYYQWADFYELDLSLTSSAPNADPDGDSYSNRTEFYFGGNPTLGHALPTTIHPSGTSFSWLQRADGSVNYTVQESTNLDSWTTSTRPIVTSPNQSDVPPGYFRQEILFPSDGKNFFRIQASGNLPDPAN